MIRSIIEWAHQVGADDPLGFAAAVGLTCFFFGWALGRISGWNSRDHQLSTSIKSEALRRSIKNYFDKRNE